MPHRGQKREGTQGSPLRNASKYYVEAGNRLVVRPRTFVRVHVGCVRVRRHPSWRKAVLVVLLPGRRVALLMKCLIRLLEILHRSFMVALCQRDATEPFVMLRSMDVIALSARGCNLSL